MVLKGAKVRDAKEKKLSERKDRSICVKLKKKVTMEKALLEGIIKTVHPGIQRAYFPRQKVPRFFFVLCSTPEKREEVWKKLKKFSNDEIGGLIPKPILVRSPRPKVTKENSTNTTTIDNLTLVLEAIPKELSTEEIQKQFPKSKESNRFNDRRCYLYFKTVEDAFEAFEKISTEPLCGHKISVKFRKIKTNTKKGKNVTQSNAEEKPEDAHNKSESDSESENEQMQSDDAEEEETEESDDDEDYTEDEEMSDEDKDNV